MNMDGEQSHSRQSFCFTASVRCFFSTILHAMGTGPDQERLMQLEPSLRAALQGFC